MIAHTFLNKFNTIIEGSDLNTGLNPIAKMSYGQSVSRALFSFPIEDVKSLCDKGFDKDSTRHYVRIANTSFAEPRQLTMRECSDISGKERLRAQSFDMYFFLIPQEWDNGIGFDYNNSPFEGTPLDDYNRATSTQASNWYNCRNGVEWAMPGVYDNDTLLNEIDKFENSGSSDVIIASQHFESGIETIKADITDVINKAIDGELNGFHGIGICFNPMLEDAEAIYEYYYGMFTQNTNTFYAPYIESVCNNAIMDDRQRITLNKKSRIYLYANINGKLTSLDELPTVNISNAAEYVLDLPLTVKEQMKGVYYTEVIFDGSYSDNIGEMFYDKWSNIKYNGVELDDIELSFTIGSPESFFNIGLTTNNSTRIIPTLYGISKNEKILPGDVRKVSILCRPEFTANSAVVVSDIEWMLYVCDGDRKVTVFPWDSVNRAFNENFVMLDTKMLLPQEYHISVKVKVGGEEIIHNDTLSFFITSETNRF